MKAFLFLNVLLVAIAARADYEIKVGTRAGGDEEQAQVRLIGAECSTRSGLEDWKKADSKKCEKAR